MKGRELAGRRTRDLGEGHKRAKEWNFFLLEKIVTSVPSPAHVAKTLWEQGRAQARRGAPARAFLQDPEVTQETWRGVSAQLLNYTYRYTVYSMYRLPTGY